MTGINANFCDHVFFSTCALPPECSRSIVCDTSQNNCDVYVESRNRASCGHKAVVLLFDSVIDGNANFNAPNSTFIVFCNRDNTIVEFVRGRNTRRTKLPRASREYGEKNSSYDLGQICDVVLPIGRHFQRRSIADDVFQVVDEVVEG